MQKKLPEDSLFKKKGFFVALYACVGVVLVLAAIVSYNNINSLGTLPQTSEQPASEVNKGLTQPNTEIGGSASIMTPADTSAEQFRASASSEPGTGNAPTYSDAPIAQARANAAEQVEPEDVKKGTDAPASSEKPGAETTPTPSSAAPPSGVPEKSDKKVSQESASLEFEKFDESDKMDWPVTPEEEGIVMDFSVDHLIFDKTLDQYRTNDNICIAAKQGAPVQASTAGVVLKVEKTNKDGNTVTIDNGNGWTTTYGQLMDRMTVKEGDVVRRDQVIGGVASPSNYSIQLGSHVTFKVEKDNVPVDPKTVLTEMD